jgi:transcriptional regulator with XRE-family HTH domain
MASLGDSIRTVRKAAGLTQQRLAARVGVCRQTLARWERNEARPDPEMLRRLAAALRVEGLTFG